MAKRKYWRIAAGFLFGLSAVAFLAAVIAIGPLGGIPQKVRAQTILSSSLILFLSFTGLSIIARNNKRAQVQAWRRAFTVWNEGVRAGARLESPIPIPATGAALEYFAIKLFGRMGYRLIHQDFAWGGHTIYHMANPDGDVELFECIQRETHVSLGEVCDLFEWMNEAGARRSILWAPGGFTQNASRWALGKPLLLADQRDIHWFVHALVEVLGGDI